MDSSDSKEKRAFTESDFFLALGDYRARYSEVKRDREGKSAYEFHKAIADRLPSLPSLNFHDIGKTQEASGAGITFFSPSDLNTGAFVWLRTKCPKCGDIAAYHMPIVRRGLFASFRVTVVKCRMCDSCFYVADGIAVNPEDNPWTDETRRDNLEGTSSNGDRKKPAEGTFLYAVQEYREHYAEAKEARGGRTAYELREYIREKSKPVLLPDHKTLELGKAENAFFQPYTMGQGSIIYVWVKTKCPTCGRVSACRMIIFPDSQFSSIATSLAICKHCSAHFYVADGIVEHSEQNPWTDETRQYSSMDESVRNTLNREERMKRNAPPMRVYTSFCKIP